MGLYRHRWVQLLAGLALGLQLLIASGLAMAAPAAHCGAAQTQAMHGGHCPSCDTHGHGTTTHASGLCKVACAVASTAAPVPVGAFALQASRDAAPASTTTLTVCTSFDDLLRPPAGAAVRAA